MDENGIITSPLLGGSDVAAPSLNVGEMATEETRRASIEPNRNSIRVVNSLTGGGDTEEGWIREIGDAEEVKKGCCSKFCHILDTWPVVFVLVSAAIGICVGIGLAFWTPEDPSTKDTAILWIGLIGELFIRSLKCIILPLVFVSIAISVMDMMSLGEAGRVVGTTIGLYVLTTFAAAFIGVLSSFIFSRYYHFHSGEEAAVNADVRLACQIDQNGSPTSYLTELENGSVACSDNSSTGMDNSSLFTMEDINGYFAKSANAEGPPELSLSESIYQGVFMQLIPQNMLGMFVDSNFLGVIVLGAGFGVALSCLTKKMPDGVNWTKILTVQILEELMQVFMLFVSWIIKCTPFAIISLIASAIGKESDLAKVMEQLGYLVAAIVVGLILQFTVVYCGLYMAFLRKNPLRYYKQMIPAFSLAFASSSSAATLPVSINCVIRSGQASDGIAKFCLPLGATINMDGAGIQIICSCIWLAYNNGITPTAADYILLVICATFGSMGTAPVPSAALVLILTSYTTTFGSNGETPAGFGYLVAIDWLIDRLSTMFNIGGDITVTAIVSNRVEKDLQDKAEKGELDESTGSSA